MSTAAAPAPQQIVTIGVASKDALSAAIEAVGARPRRAQRRPTKPAPYDLANHSKAFLEGGQYANAYEFLNSLLAAGTSISTPAQPYAGYLAPPSQIALAASLVPYKFKSPSRETSRGSDAAFRYLQCLLSTIDGPSYPYVRRAFAFPTERTRRNPRGHRNTTRSLSPTEDDDIDHLYCEVANDKSLWYRADDVWHIVGWAFNCSAAYKKRWERWTLWLTAMLDFLEADWEVCTKQSQHEHEEDGQEGALQQSLIWQYVSGEGQLTTRTIRRRIAKAIFAIASTESLKDYPEIWENETKEPRELPNKRQKLGNVDFEVGEVADYDSDDEVKDTLARATRAIERKFEAAPPPQLPDIDNGSLSLEDAIERLGGSDAIVLRQRLLALVTQVAVKLPNQFTKLSDWFDNVVEDFRFLPTMLFNVFLTTLAVPGPMKYMFLANLLIPFVSGTLPDYFRYDPTQEHFESILLPLKGSQSFAANAKVSLILEQLFILMMADDRLESTNALREAMETGIQARRNAYGSGRGKRGKAGEEKQARELMEASSSRLLGMLEMLKIMAVNPSQRRADCKNSILSSFGSGSPLSSVPSDMEEDED
ncbi:uncharacterized protein M421DRAFT_347187 [Didymella exigua CBS 183.55]|uniref:Uncharacterized protein n=1 Tax=Didymella exigua CBS 183.55 TaxID=1150837 RepID=A0A6A5RYP4_9PLEO|nr:uncharacterized protein M421DRAFT_347187 [Didymella exigua CBS 183.55]KAF1931426.1 hypothetical protein M421DRAFT_347187 [Didymella exigua CBS 183.55]